MAKVCKNKPPSRVKYEKAHPTVSCRVPQQVYAELAKAKVTTGRSFADFLKIGLGIVQARTKVDEALKKRCHQAGYQAGHQDGYEAGHEDGFAKAKETYLVTYPCSDCGKALSVTSKNAKAAVAKLMHDAGWHHTNCPPGD